MFKKLPEIKYKNLEEENEWFWLVWGYIFIFDVLGIVAILVYLDV